VFALYTHHPPPPPNMNVEFNLEMAMKTNQNYILGVLTLLIILIYLMPVLTVECVIKIEKLYKIQ
jgi:hypothetical protein